MSAPAKPLPDVGDPLTAPFWAAAREGRLTVQRCAACGYLRWPPGPICNECQTPGGEWTDVRAAGMLVTYAEYHRAFNPAFAGDLPYTVGLIELADGPRMYGLMLSPLRTQDIGRHVRGVFEAVTPDVTFVRWELEDGSVSA